MRLTFDRVAADWAEAWVAADWAEAWDASAGVNKMAGPDVADRTWYAPIGRREWLLFAVACCRLVWAYVSDVSRQDVRAVARYAEEGRTETGTLMQEAYARPRTVGIGATFLADYGVAQLVHGGDSRTYRDSVRRACRFFTEVAVDPRAYVTAPRPPYRLYLAACDQGLLLAHTVSPGWKFRPAWRTSTALALAGGIYSDRAWDRCPILADALQDAGCEEPLVLDYLRGDAPKFRGCRVLDEVLGKRKK